MGDVLSVKIRWLPLLGIMIMPLIYQEDCCVIRATEC